MHSISEIMKKCLKLLKQDGDETPQNLVGARHCLFGIYLNTDKEMGKIKKN